MSYALAAHVSLTETEHGTVLLDERTGRYWQTNETGAVVMRCLLEGADADAAVEALQEQYPGAAEQLAEDVASLLTALIAARMVTS